ncbi:MAG: hypothetical protein PHO76_13005 [Methylotenera sp.]|nr:hypothetical protein [Methylotenera sp.]MDD4926151.1 hypothetical protein [Methylotenera sp.]
MKSIKNQPSWTLSCLALALILAGISAFADTENDATIKSAAVLTATKYDLDYMDEGVQVIIPKMLAETKVKAGSNVLNSSQPESIGGAVASAYESAGFIPKGNIVWIFGTKYNQTLAFSGSKDSLAELNESYTKNKIIDGVLTWSGIIVRATVGYIIGGAVAGSGGSAGGVSSGVTSGHSNYLLENAKAAVFDGYELLPAKDLDIIEIYGVTSPEGSSKVIFITDRTQIDEAVVVRGIIKAQNFVKIAQ